jgi:hypothetical protein
MSDNSGDTIILHQELAYADSLPIAVSALMEPVAAPTLAAWTERNLRLLQACAALEESAAAEPQDDSSAQAAELQRIDLKVNMLLDMVGLLVASMQSRPAPRPLRFNAQGLLWEPGASVPPPDTAVKLEIFLRESMVHPLTLTGVMLDSGVETLARLRFDEPPETVADHIKKLVFRRHRRQVAIARATRRI